MALVFPARPAKDKRPMNTLTNTQPVLGPREFFQLRGFGRPRGVPDVQPTIPSALLGGAAAGDAFFLPLEE